MNGMWKTLTNGPRPLWNSSGSCEAELQDLMVQIDKLVQEKKVEWETDLHSIETKLESKATECESLKLTMDSKMNEISQLKRRLEETESSRKMTYSEYETQVASLRREVSQMAKNYERLQKKYLKQSRELEREKERVNGEAEDGATERHSLNKKLDELKRQQGEWEQERATLTKQVEQMSQAKWSWEEKYHLMQEQAAGYQSQLDRRKQILDTTEASLKTQIIHLEHQLTKAKSNMVSQNTQLEQLKGSLDETVVQYKRLFDEKEHLEGDVSQARKTVMRLEAEMSRQAEESRERHQRLEGELHKLEGEVHRLEEDLGATQHDLKAKTEELNNVVESSRSKKDSSEVVHRLEKELHEARQTLKQHRKTERRQAEELQSLTRRLDETERQCAHLDAALYKSKEKVTSVVHTSADVTPLREEIKRDHRSSQLRSESCRSEVRHLEELSSIRRANQAVEDQVASARRAEQDLMDRLGAAEKRSRSLQEEKERRDAELQVANAQLQALRLENRHLRGCVDKVGENAADEVAQAESHLKQLQTAYLAALDQLEKEKKELHESLNQTRESSESRVNTLSLTVEKLESEKRILAQQVKTQTEHMRKLGLVDHKENAVLAAFVNGLNKTLSPSKNSPLSSARSGAQHSSRIDGDRLSRGEMESNTRYPSRHEESTTAPHLYAMRLASGDLPVSATTKNVNNHFQKPHYRSQIYGGDVSSEDIVPRWQTNNHNTLHTTSMEADITQILDPSLTQMGSSIDLSAPVTTRAPQSSLTAEQFLLEEQERSRHLEDLINSHIEELKSRTESAVSSARHASSSSRQPLPPSTSQSQTISWTTNSYQDVSAAPQQQQYNSTTSAEKTPVFSAATPRSAYVASIAVSSNYGNNPTTSSNYGNNSTVSSNHGNNPSVSSNYGNNPSVSSNYGNNLTTHQSTNNTTGYASYSGRTMEAAGLDTTTNSSLPPPD